MGMSGNDFHIKKITKRNMEKWHSFIFCVLVAFSSPILGQTVLTAVQVEEMLAREKQVQLLDIRTPGEISQTGKISGARVLDFRGGNFEQGLKVLDKNRPVIVYCAAGGRSPVAAGQMKRLGFRLVYDYRGGMNDWKSRGKKTVP
jgi:rhodanese-related sulfurtransferase